MMVPTKLSFSLYDGFYQASTKLFFSAKVVELLDELASDPDDKHVPPSVRNSYRCEKVFIKIMVMDLDMVMVLDMAMDTDNEHFLSC